MASATAAVLYTLITVTNGGNVGHSGGYTSLQVCNEAKSVAMTGQTLEQRAEEAAKIKAARDKREADWLEAHPGRPPKNDDERLQMEKVGGTKHGVDPWIYTKEGEFRVRDGLLYEQPRSGVTVGAGGGVWFGGGGAPTDGIKYAECVIEP